MSIRWGFMGTGRVTRRMIEAVRQASGAELSGIASRDYDRAVKWADERLHDANRPLDERVQAFSSYESMLDDSKLDWIYIALPPSLHAEWTIRALSAGKHVLCEKPLCVDAREADEVAQASDRYQRRLFHATAFPYHPRSQLSRQIIDSGELGNLRRVHVACTFAGILSRGEDHRTAAALGGGALLDLGWYCVMSTLWFTRLDCIRVQAVGAKQGEVWNQVQVLAELSGGVWAHWDCGFDAAPRRWIEIAGDRASWICDDFLRPLDAAKPRFWIHGFEGKSRTETVGGEPFQESLMIEACQDPQHQASAQLEWAIQTHRILDGIEESLKSKQVVSLK